MWREGSSLPVGPVRRLPVSLLGLSSRTSEHRMFRGGLDGETLDLFSRPVWPQASQSPWVGSPSDSRAARRRLEPLSCQPLQGSAGGWRAEQGGGPSCGPRAPLWGWGARALTSSLRSELPELSPLSGRVVSPCCADAFFASLAVTPAFRMLAGRCRAGEGPGGGVGRRQAPRTPACCSPETPAAEMPACHTRACLLARLAPAQRQWVPGGQQKLGQLGVFWGEPPALFLLCSGRGSWRHRRQGLGAGSAPGSLAVQGLTCTHPGPAWHGPSQWPS